ncbi:MAG: ABC transporter ATP-binding protein, partial [Sphaerochaetaceae bacterium]|nr:ABC transporter ATP-binding protein [Sphaerochaetaceae bacterium]
VAIARTLATNPKVLLMDEPLSNLDAKLRMEMRAELKRLHKETGATFVYVTHDQLEAMTLATKICLLKDGLLQMFNSPLDVYLKPLNTFVADFVGSPAINLISFKYNKIGKHKIKLVNEFFDFSFESNNELPENLGEEVTIGIRPEYIKVSETGKFEVEVYTSLPSGMETILGLIMNDSKRINCVVFGANDFSVGNMVKVDFIGSEIVLFNDQGIFAALGKLLY